MTSGVLNLPRAGERLRIGRLPPAVRRPFPLATAHLSPRQRMLVAADPRLERLLDALDRATPADAPDDSAACEIAGVSRTTLWRICRAALGCTHTEFVRRWRVRSAAAIYRAGRSDYCQDGVARIVGLSNAARLRAAFVACTGLLPTGRPPTARLRIVNRRLPLLRMIA